MRTPTASVSYRLIAALAFQLLAAIPATLALADTPSSARLRAADLRQIDTVVQSEIEAGRIGGAVVEIGQGRHIVYRHAFGHRELEPRRVAMTPDTIFDLASLTKPVATAVAIKQLHDHGRIDLDAPVAIYWPAFASNGKERITIRQLMTHHSGLAPDLDLSRKWSGYSTAMKMIEDAKPLRLPGSHYEYSDINFEALGEVVRRVAKLPLDDYCRINIFRPLGMTDTGFMPAARKLSRIAPTEYVAGKLLIGEVNDPTAARMGGIAGHAGLFSTANDLAVFARMLLGGGRIWGYGHDSFSTFNRRNDNSSIPVRYGRCEPLARARMGSRRASVCESRAALAGRLVRPFRIYRDDAVDRSRLFHLCDRLDQPHLPERRG